MADRFIRTGDAIAAGLRCLPGADQGGYQSARIARPPMLGDVEQMPVNEAIRRAEWSARIAAARIVLRAAAASGNWLAIEIAHERLVRLETDLWLIEKFGVSS